jgi:hypothetical protein
MAQLFMHIINQLVSLVRRWDLSVTGVPRCGPLVQGAGFVVPVECSSTLVDTLDGFVQFHVVIR